MNKIFTFLFFIIQLINFQVDVLGSEILENEIKTYVEYVSGWTESGIANDINAKLDLLQRNAETESKLLNIKDIKIAPEWGYAFIIYEVSNKISGKMPISTRLEYASAWTGSGIANDINAKLDLLQRNAETESKLLNIKDIKITLEWGYAFIIYEVSDFP